MVGDSQFLNARVRTDALAFAGNHARRQRACEVGLRVVQANVALVASVTRAGFCVSVIRGRVAGAEADAMSSAAPTVEARTRTFRATGAGP